MRTLNSVKNMASGLLLSLTMVAIGFFTRKVFVDNVGVEYLGLNGLLTNILGVMALLEGGFATSVTYNLYKPLAENDQPRIIALIQLYRKVYRYIAVGVFFCGLAIYPFLNLFIKDANGLQYVSVVYFIFLFNSLIQYFTAYKWSLINTSQQNYRLTAINMVYQVGLAVAKIFILYYTSNYIAYLLVESAFGLGLNVAVVRKCDQLFPFIKTKIKYNVSPEVRKNIITNMKALFLHSVGGYFMHSTDNIVVSSFIGVTIIGFWANYTLITTNVSTLISQILNSFSESIGNLIASENTGKVYDIFRTAFFVNFIVVSVPLIIMWNTMTPFITWWLGTEYVLDDKIVFLILLNFFLLTMRIAPLTFKTKSGIFVKDRWTPLLQGIINLGLSLLLVQTFGLSGVLGATAISILAISFWQWPRLCYIYIFYRPVKRYFTVYAAYTAIMLVCIITTGAICSIIHISHPLGTAIVNGLITLVITISIYFVAFRHTFAWIDLKTHVSVVISRRRNNRITGQI